MILITFVKRINGIDSFPVKHLTLFKKHNEECALRVGINRAKGSCNAYLNTYRLLSDFIQYGYKVTDAVIKRLDVSFSKAFEVYSREERKQTLYHIRLYIPNVWYENTIIMVFYITIVNHNFVS